MSAYKIRKALKVSTFFMVDRILHPHRLLQVIPKKWLRKWLRNEKGAETQRL